MATGWAWSAICTRWTRTPEVRTGTVSGGCPAGAYTLRASVSSPGNVELASASASFSVGEPETPLSKDAALGGLTLSGVDIGTFDPDTTGYAADVDNDVTETTVTPTVNDDGASYLIKLDGVADADGTVSLAVGSNVITVEVTAADGETAKTYTVTVTRAAPPLSSDATLSGVDLSGVDFGAFDPVTSAYTAEVDNGVTETTVTATVNDDGASYTVKLDGVADSDGVIPLVVGSNVITVEVTAEDGNTTRTYTVTVTRAAPDEPEPEPPPSSPPDAPERPTGEVTGRGQVRLDWNDAAGAEFYQVRFCCGNQDWVELPTDGIEIVIDGSGATLSNLPGLWHLSLFSASRQCGRCIRLVRVPATLKRHMTKPPEAWPGPSNP